MMKKKGLWAATLALLVCCGVWGLGFRLPVRPVFPAPQDVPSADELFQKPWTERPVLLVGLGDSVTAGFGASPGKSYVDRLQAALKPVLPNLKTLNLAVSGSTSLQHLALEIPKLPPQPPEVLGLIVMTSGGNDLIHDYGRTPPREGAMYGAGTAEARPWIQAYETRLGTMLDRIQVTFPGGCHVFVADIYDPTDGKGDLERAGLPAWKDAPALLEAYNRVIARTVVARPGVHLVGMHEVFLGHGIHCGWGPGYRDHPGHWYNPNFEDPNDHGYEALSRLFLREIAKAIHNPA